MLMPAAAPTSQSRVVFSPVSQCHGEKNQIMKGHKSLV